MHQVRAHSAAGRVTHERQSMTTDLDTTEAGAAFERSEGWGADRSPLQRPGIPQEFDPPHPLASAHWLVPEQQHAIERPLVGHGMQLTPVFSSAIPARGFSGALRHWAYGMPDYHARRWALLMLADRIDVLEHRPGRLVKAVAALGLLGFGGYALYRVRRA
jgi:hypothetical protein